MRHYIFIQGLQFLKGYLRSHSFNMAQGYEAVKPPKGHFYLAGRLFPRVKWWKQRNMRVLYFYILILIATNTANGFDNSMM
jgi:hypothetical protein